MYCTPLGVHARPSLAIACSKLRHERLLHRGSQQRPVRCEADDRAFETQADGKVKTCGLAGRPPLLHTSPTRPRTQHEYAPCVKKLYVASVHSVMYRGYCIKPSAKDTLLTSPDASAQGGYCGCISFLLQLPLHLYDFGMLNSNLAFYLFS